MGVCGGECLLWEGGQETGRGAGWGSVGGGRVRAGLVERPKKGEGRTAA